MQRLSKEWTTGKAIEHLKAKSQEFKENKITSTTWAEILYASLCEIQELLGLKDSDEYSDSVELDPLDNVPGGLLAFGDGLTYVVATKVLTIPSGVFTGGNFSTGFTNFNAINVQGGVFYLHRDYKNNQAIYFRK